MLVIITENLCNVLTRTPLLSGILPAHRAASRTMKNGSRDEGADKYVLTEQQKFNNIAWNLPSGQALRAKIEAIVALTVHLKHTGRTYTRRKR